MTPEIYNAVLESATKHGIEKAALLAVIEVESGGFPFESADGVTPRFLFERHEFYRRLKHNSPDKLQEALNQGLANLSWQPGTQYLDQRTSQHRLDLLTRAISVDPASAYESCSWGLGQTMGYHFENLGYSSAKDMVESMKGNIPAQIEAMIGEIKHSNLMGHLANHDWAKFARGYNGDGYKRNRYDQKLASAYLKACANSQFCGQGEVLTSSYISRPSEHPQFDSKFATIQRKLRDLGYPVGEIDGKHGKIAAGAIESYQTDNNLVGDRGCWYASYSVGLEHAKPYVSYKRITTSTSDFVKKDPLAAKLSWTKSVLAFLGIGVGGASTFPETIGAVTSDLSALGSLHSLISKNHILLLGLILIGAALAVHWALVCLRNAYRRFDYQGTSSPVQADSENNDSSEIRS